MENDISSFPRWERIANTVTLERIQRLTRDCYYDLNGLETWWRERYNRGFCVFFTFPTEVEQGGFT